MFVNEIKHIASKSRISTQKTRAAGASFKTLTTEDSADVTGVNKAVAITLPDIGLPLQWQTPFSSKKVICAYGEDVLDLLKTLHRNMILGVDIKDTVTKLQEVTTHSAPLAEDEQLNELIKAIKLRAAVEVAKKQAQQ